MNNLSLLQIESELTVLRTRFNQDKGKLALLEQQLEHAQTSLSQTCNDIQILNKTQIVLSKMADFSRAQLNTRIEKTTTSGLRAIFQNDEMEFKVATNAPGETPSAKFQVSGMCDGIRYFSEPEEFGAGGELDTESLAIRMATMESTRPRTEGPILFDEPAKMVSKLGGSVQRVAGFIKAYLEATNRQGIMITHHEPMGKVADLVQGVVKIGGVSQVMSGEEYYSRRRDDGNEIEEVSEAS